MGIGLVVEQRLNLGLNLGAIGLQRTVVTFVIKDQLRRRAPLETSAGSTS